jgi:lambda family phage portal protein
MDRGVLGPRPAPQRHWGRLLSAGFAAVAGAADPALIGWAPGGFRASASMPGYVGVPAVRSVGHGSMSYNAASFGSQELAGFNPSQTSADSEILPASRLALDRTRDLIRNDPHASAAVMRMCDMLVGNGWNLISTPDYKALGISPEQARDIGRKIESEWRLYTRDPRKYCDARRRLSHDGLLRLLARSFVSGAEAAYFLTWRGDPGARYQTALGCVDPDRISNPHGETTTARLRGGVEFDEHGAPIAYHVRNAHPSDWFAPEASESWTRIPRETPYGRPVFVHGFEPDREDASRAMTPFASLVSRLRMISKHADLEIASATANAMFAAFIESDLPVEDVVGRLQPGGNSIAGTAYAEKIVEHYSKNPHFLGGVRLPVLLPGTKVTLNSAPRQTTAFPAFQTSFLRSIASRIGVSYEQLAMDWSQTNYSSARAALNEVWRTIRRMQAVFAEQLVQPMYFAWLMEAFDKGFVGSPAGAPGFWDMPEAWCQARWIGPGRGYVDPVKEAEASSLRMMNMTSTLQDECADQGADYEQTLDQIAREESDLKDRGLTRLSLVAALNQNKGPKPDSEEATGPAGPGGEDKRS